MRRRSLAALIESEAPPVEAVEQALAEARNVVVFAYTVAFIPIDRIFRSRHIARTGKKVDRSMTRVASQHPESLPPIVALRSRTHPGFYAVASGLHIFNAAKMAHLKGLWAVIADHWVEVA